MRLIVLCFLLAACSAATPHRTAGQPPEYRAGYADGCSSGYVAAGHPYHRFTKNVHAYAAQPLYKQGWDDGQVTCKSEYEATARMLR